MPFRIFKIILVEYSEGMGSLSIAGKTYLGRSLRGAASPICSNLFMCNDPFLHQCDAATNMCILCLHIYSGKCLWLLVITTRICRLSSRRQFSGSEVAGW